MGRWETVYRRPESSREEEEVGRRKERGSGRDARGEVEESRFSKLYRFDAPLLEYRESSG
jgi:hypothetical protein